MREARAAQMAAAGRWSLIGMAHASVALPGAETGTGGGADIEGGAKLAARVLLDRYGVVFRRLCTREPWLPPWHELVAVYRRRDGRGELRGGRSSPWPRGEQFALPEVVELLREVRQPPRAGWPRRLTVSPRLLMRRHRRWPILSLLRPDRQPVLSPHAHGFLRTAWRPSSRPRAVTAIANGILAPNAPLRAAVTARAGLPGRRTSNPAKALNRRTRSVGKPGPGSGPAGRAKDETTGHRRSILGWML